MFKLSKIGDFAEDIKDNISTKVKNATSDIGDWLEKTYNNAKTANIIKTPNILTNNKPKTSASTDKSKTSTLKAYQQNKDKTTVVENIQKSLNTLGYKYGNEGELKVDGDFGIKTETNWNKFIKDRCSNNFLSNVVTGVSDLYSNLKDLSNKNDNNTINISNQKKFQPIVSKTVSDTEVNDEEIGSAWDVMKSWREYEKSTHYLTDDKNSEKARSALKKAKGVKAEEISFYLAGESYTVGTAMDASGEEVKYVTKGSTYINNPDTKSWLVNLVAKVGVELGASTQTVYYNAPIEVVTQGASETTGFTLGALGVDVTTINDSYGNKKYTGISFPTRLGLGFNHSLNKTREK